VLNLEETDTGIVFDFSDVNWDEHGIPELIRSIKEIVPKEFRSYDDRTKSWYVHSDYVFSVKELFSAWSLL